MNSSSEPSPSKAPDELDGGETAACVILGLSFLIGTPGNLLVIWTILRHIKKRFHTVVLILHLAVADTLILITLPLWIYSLMHTWMFGETLCKVLVYVIIACLFGSIFLITLMSVERFLAICYPFLWMRWKTKLHNNRCLALLWLLALLLGVPEFVTHTVDESDGAKQCFNVILPSETQTIIILCLQTLLGFVLPLIVLSVCYCLVAAKLQKIHFRWKQKSRGLIHIVVIVFILSWLPYHVINITNVACIQLSDSGDDCVPESLVFSSGALIFISSSVNPVLYVFFASNFKSSLEESRLVRLFQDVAKSTNKLWELAMQQQNDQRAANTQTEETSSSAFNTVNQELCLSENMTM